MSLHNLYFYKVFLIGALLSAFSLSSVSYAETKKETLLIGGTGSALGGIQLVADAFNATQSEIQVSVLPSLGSGGGIKAVIKNAIDIAVSARAPKTKELDQGVLAKIYARTPLVIATSIQTDVDNMTLLELEKFYAKPQQFWRNGIPVRLVLRPQSESDIKTLRQFSKKMNSAVDRAYLEKGLLIATSDQKNASLLEDIPGSLGISTLGQITSEKRNLKIISLDGVKPSIELIKASQYTFIKDLYLITSKEGSNKNTKFINYLVSFSGSEVLRKNGYLPVNNEPKKR